MRPQASVDALLRNQVFFPHRKPVPLGDSVDRFEDEPALVSYVDNSEHRRTCRTDPDTILTICTVMFLVPQSGVVSTRVSDVVEGALVMNVDEPPCDMEGQGRPVHT